MWRLLFLSLPVVSLLLSYGGPNATAAPAVSRRPEIRWDPASVTLIASNGCYGRIIRLRNGEMVCGYDVHGKITVRHSPDGRNWLAPRLVSEWPLGRLTNTELLQTQSGSLLCFFNARPREKGAARSADPARYAICLSRSEDNGKTWGAAQTLYSAGAEFTNGCWEPAAIQLSSGEIQVFFSDEGPYRHSEEQNISMLRSVDNGKTFSRPEIVSFRPGHRDGMPVPLVLQGNRGVAFAIEDNGLNGNFKPSIIYSSLAENWKEGTRSPGSSNRWSALAQLPPPQTAASAPYLRQMPCGETLLSVQQSETGEMHQSRMVVYIGDASAKDFGRPSYPFPESAGRSQLWNSLFIKDRNTIIAVSETTINGTFGIWSVEGQFIR